MTYDDNSLGGRLPLLEPAAMTQQQRAYYDAVIADQPPGSSQEQGEEGYAIQDGDGRLIGPFNAFLRRPEVASAFVAFAEASARYTSLSARVREIVVLSTCSAWGAAYPVYAHERTARQAGLQQSVIKEIVSGNIPDVLSDQEQAAARMTQHLVTAHTIDDTLYDRALDQFGEQGLFDIVALIGQYLTASAIANLFSVPAP